MFDGCFEYNHNSVFPLVMQIGSWYLNMNEEQLLWFIEGQTHLNTSWHAKMKQYRVNKEQTSTLH